LFSQPKPANTRPKVLTSPPYLQTDSAFPQGCVKPLARDVPILFRQLPNGAAETLHQL
jgi:hypothetical protein